MSTYAVAVTGGIASGKSAVTAAFEKRGIVVADADLAARDVVAPGSQGLAEITRTFGTKVLTADGSLDRAWVEMTALGVRRMQLADLH